MKKGNCNLFIKIQLLVKFHEEIMIFEEIRGHLVIYHFTMPMPEILRVFFEKETQIFEVEELETQNLYRTRLI